MIDKEAVQKIINNAKKYKLNQMVGIYEDKKGNEVEEEFITVTDETTNGLVVDSKLERVAKLSIYLYNAAENIGPLKTDDEIARYLASFAPFLNDLENRIQYDYNHGNLSNAVEINTAGIEKLLEKHEDCNKHFYDFADQILGDPTALQALSEHALDKHLSDGVICNYNPAKPYEDLEWSYKANQKDKNL